MICVKFPNLSREVGFKKHGYPYHAYIIKYLWQKRIMMVKSTFWKSTFNEETYSDDPLQHINILISLINTTIIIVMYWIVECFFVSLVKLWWDRHFGYTDTCANSLAEVKCSSGKIRIKDVISYSNAEGCDELTKDCAKDRLEQLCDDRRVCTQDTTTDSWLFHKRYANIYYYCKSKQNVILYWIRAMKHSKHYNYNLEVLNLLCSNMLMI